MAIGNSTGPSFTLYCHSRKWNSGDLQRKDTCLGGQILALVTLSQLHISIFNIEWYGNFNAKDLDESGCALFQHLPAWTDEHHRRLQSGAASLWTKT
jgi:hypothetical protein